MTGTDTQPPTRADSVPRRVLASLAGVSLVLALALAAASRLAGQPVLPPLAALVVVVALVLRGLGRDYPHRRFGAANVVTLGRAALVCFLIGAVFAPGTSDALILSVAIVAFALDGVDGWLARRGGLTSCLGARFDMETDAALAAVLSVWLMVTGTTGAEILILGFTRYAFVLAAVLLPALRQKLFPSFRRKAVCVIQIAALLILVFPPTPAAVVTLVSIVAPALVLGSFAIDTVWLLRRPVPRPSRAEPGAVASASVLVRALRLILAAAILHLVLILPAHPAGLAWATLARVPLELPLLLLGLAALGRTPVGLSLHVGLTAGLSGLVMLKATDIATVLALGRAFNPVADLALIAPAHELLSDAIGRAETAAALVAAGLSLVAIGWAIWWATGTFADAAPRRRAWRVPVALAAGLAGGGVIADLADRGPLPAQIAEARSARLLAGKIATARATFRDLRAFRAAAASDPYAGVSGLLDRIDRDVILVFVESYGRTSLDTPLYADLHRATLAAGEERLTGLGLATASGLLASPTRGGQSWLAHASVANGLWIDGETRYRAVLASKRRTLYHLAAEAGFHTAAVMPQITSDWPESATMGFETVLEAADLGYEGESFNWVTMPDQFTYAALDRLLRGADRDRNLFVQVATGSSHAPWVPVPELVPWDAIGDGRIFNEMARSGDTPETVWKDRDRVRAQYRLAVDYALQAVLSYAAQQADDPPLLIVMGDHQAAGFVAQDSRPDTPLHVIGPAHLVERAMGWGLTPGLLPRDAAPVVRMDRLRDLFVAAFSSAAPDRHAAK